MTNDQFKPGKIPFEILANLIAQNPLNDPQVIIGPRFGEDAAVIAVQPDKYLVFKSDPITFTTDRMGWYLVHVNANDIAVMGGVPKWLLVTSLLPETSTTLTMVETILADLTAACQELRISLIGGHTEVTPGLTKPILVGHLIGEIEKSNLVDKRNIKLGDLILLTKGIAIEGTSIIAREKYQELTEDLTDEILDRAKNFIYEPGISVVKDARIAIEHGGIHGMHDPTEGGLLGGVFELVDSLGLGVELYESKIPIFPETIEFCRHFSLDPLRLIASGALLVVLPSERIVGLQHRYREAGIETALIGRVVEGSKKIRVKRLAGWDFVEAGCHDEITRIL